MTAAMPFAALAAGPFIDTIVVRLRADPPPGGAATLTNTDRDALLGSLRSTFSVVGHTRQGGYLLQFSTPLPLDAARAALNRARLLPQVLYANAADPGTTAAGDPAVARAAAAQQPPVARMIVKFRDAAITAAASLNIALGASSLSRLSTLAGQPVAHQRAMSGGAYVVRLFEALPPDHAASLASYLESDPTVEYIVPDLRKQPMLVPNDPVYASQWHYMGPPAEMGGVNLPPAWDITTGEAGIVVAVLDTAAVTGDAPSGSITFTERAGSGWANGGGWNDATGATFPDWVQTLFNGTKTIDRVVVYTLQDNHGNPGEPTDTMTFTSYGVRDFTVHGWNGTAWVTLASIAGNNLVKRTVTFTAYTTDRIRINITNALASYSRITEIEARGLDAAGAP